jgi:hypothetical protein
VAEQARIRISLSAGELEVNGTQEFVAQYENAIRSLIGRLENEPIRPAVSSPDPTTGSGSRSASPQPDEKREFGEVLHALPSNASGPDRILVAGSYAQLASGDNTFSTGEANQLLLGQGVKLSNASQALKNAIAAKRVFKVGGRYRVSKIGEEHLKTLIGQ